MNLVVVSNRVSRGKPNEPMTGGLAAALLPVVEKSGAIWVGSSGRVRDGLQKEPLAEIEALGTGRACDARSAGRALRRLLRRLRQFGAVAGAAFAQRSDPRHAGRLSQLSRGQRLHGARAAALQQARHRVLGAGLSFPVARRGAARPRRRTSRSASSSTRRGRRLPSSRACRIIASWSRRCWPMI